MPVNSTHSKGLELQKGDGGTPTEVFTKVGGVIDMPAFSATKSTVEDTDISDSNRHYIAGIGEPGSFTLTIVFDASDSQQSALITQYDAETEGNFRVQAPDTSTTTYEFKALVTGYSTPYAGINELLMQEFTFQLVENDSGDIITDVTT